MSAPTLPLGVPSRVRVLVVDDNDAFRESLASLLDGEEMEIIGQACSGSEAIEMVRALAPDVVLMDVRMPEMDGIEATRRLKALQPSLGVVALTGFEEQRTVRDMLVAGASGYVLKDSDGDEIINAIRRAASGGALLSSEVTPTVIEELIEALERERRRTRQLEIAQEALLERTARRQQLIGRVGHELRTPVTVILGLAQSLQRGGMSHEQFEEVLDTLVSRTDGLARLVRRFEAAVEAGLTEWANVTDLACDVADREPRVRVEAPPTPVMTTLNRTAGLRILEELVENALAFSPDDAEVTIRISSPVPGVSPQVRVIDEGPGVESEAVLRIFEPLEQAQDLHTRTHPGVGLGLSLARLSARAMDGDVTLEQTGPEGSTFLWTVAPGAAEGTTARVR
jgi:DNA-binding NarL/FixJ family response regulator